MRIDVLLGEARTAPADVADRVVVVIDVLRAATTAATAFINGARVVVPFESVDDTRRASVAYGRHMINACETGNVLTAGERAMVRISGFDLGNSPLEYTRDVVDGRTILFTTTNGTAALVAAQRARAIFFAAFVNAIATVRAVGDAIDAHRDLVGVTIVCAGTDGSVSLEDVVCAGRLVRTLAARSNIRITDSARIALLTEQPYVNDLALLARDATHAHALVTAGFGEDVECCLAADTVPVAVRFCDGALTRVETSEVPHALRCASDGSQMAAQVS